MSRIGTGIAIAFFSVALAATAQAEEYPSRPVHLVVPYSAGGGTDVVGRVIVDKLSEQLGQPVIVENKPGAGARLGVDYVAAQPADGYTILIAGGSELSISPLIYKTNYTAASFVPLTIAIEMPLILLAAPNIPAKTPAELAAWAKANPDKSNYATTAPGFTLPAELFKLKSGAPGVAITYKSAGEGAVALMGGAAAWATFTPPGVVNLVKEGKLRALAVTTSTRSPDLPDVPTMKELGIDIGITNWNGFFVPAGTPKPVADKLAKELRDIVLNTDVKDKLRGMFTNPVGLTPQQTTQHIEGDVKVWKAVIEAANLKFGN